MEWITTSTILSRLVDYRDQSVWERFDGRFRPAVVRFARKLGLPESDAEDVAQEALLTFAEAYRVGKYQAGRGRLSSWLFGIAYRTAANARRALARRKDLQNSTEFWCELPEEREAERIWDAQWQAAALENAERQVRNEVTESTFRAYRSVVREGLTPAEAGERLGLSRDAVYIAKHRVLKRLREIIADHDTAESG